MLKAQPSSKAFTIVELLIVIVVIAILAAISIVAYTGFQSRGAAASIQSDLTKIAKQLAVDRTFLQHYPDSLDQADDGKGVHVSSTNDYIYTTTEGNADYCLTVYSPTYGAAHHISSSTDSPQEGACPGHTLPVGGGGPIANQPTSCPSGFIPVPGNSHYGTDGGFCVMKYEAKDVGGVATSQAKGVHWGSGRTSWDGARVAAQGACSGCKLITEPEWMTIATDVLSVPSNWVSGTVGVGIFRHGHTSDNPWTELEASLDDNEGNLGVEHHDSGHIRTLTLTNGEVIWDFSGNAWEWTDATITGNQPGLLGGPSSGTWKDYNNSNLQWNGLPSMSRPTGTLYPQSQRVGRLWSNPSDSSARAFIRGGSYGNYAYSGVLALHLGYSPSALYYQSGFRSTK